jgi:hypothetical protein
MGLSFLEKNYSDSENPRLENYFRRHPKKPLELLFDTCIYEYENRLEHFF